MKVAVLVSGSGSNLQAILDAAAGPAYAASVGLVLSDKPGVGALVRAEAAGVPRVVVPWRRDRAAFTAEVCDAVDAHGCEAMALAGFMRILGPEAIDRFGGRIINVHPSLLPAFPGAHAVPQALAHGVKLSGVTVHLVDEEVDHGPIVAQRAVPVYPDDDEASLHARIQVEEHDLFPPAIDALARGLLWADGRRVRVQE